MNIRPDEHLEKLAMNLFNIGAVKFKAPLPKLGGRIATPPTSPIEINLRTVSHPERPGGPLTPSILRDIGQAFNTMLVVRKVKYAAVCGVPHAGMPLALYLGDFAGWNERGRAFVTLKKTVDANGKRRIAEANSRSPHLARTVLIDDVLYKAETKLKAIDALTEAGWMTTHTLVVIDRCQGGQAELRKRGVQAFSLFTLPWLVDFYTDRGVITQEMSHRVKAYIKENT